MRAENVKVGIIFSSVGDDDGLFELYAVGVEAVFVSVGMKSLVGEVSAVGLEVVIVGSTYLVSCVALGGEGVRSSSGETDISDAGGCPHPKSIKTAIRLEITLKILIL